MYDWFDATMEQFIGSLNAVVLLTVAPVKKSSWDFFSILGGAGPPY